MSSVVVVDMRVGTIKELEELVVMLKSPVVTFVSLCVMDTTEALPDFLLEYAVVCVTKTVLVTFPVLFRSTVDDEAAMLLFVPGSNSNEVDEASSGIEVVVLVSPFDSDVVSLLSVFVGSDDGVSNSEVLSDSDNPVEKIDDDPFVLSRCAGLAQLDLTHNKQITSSMVSLGEYIFDFLHNLIF